MNHLIKVPLLFLFLQFYHMFQIFLLILHHLYLLVNLICIIHFLDSLLSSHEMFFYGILFVDDNACLENNGLNIYPLYFENENDYCLGLLNRIMFENEMLNLEDLDFEIWKFFALFDLVFLRELYLNFVRFFNIILLVFIFSIFYYLML